MCMLCRRLGEVFLPLKRCRNLFFKYFFIHFSTLKSKLCLFPGPQLSLSDWVIEYILCSPLVHSLQIQGWPFLKTSLVEVSVLIQRELNAIPTVGVTWSDWTIKTALYCLKSSSGNWQKHSQPQWPIGKQQRLFVRDKFHLRSHQKSNSKD